MNRLGRGMAAVALVAAAAGLAYGALRHHVVATDRGVVVLTKRYLAFTDTFVDARAWASADFDAHSELKRALADQGYRDLLAEAKKRDLQAALDGVKDKAAAAAEEFADKVADTAETVAGKVSETVEPWLGGETGSPAPAGETP